MSTGQVIVDSQGHGRDETWLAIAHFLLPLSLILLTAISVALPQGQT